MSLPPGFLDELRSRTSIAQVAGRKVMWDTKKSNRGKGDWWAPCPFHQEKTASFHVDDSKGFYYCFGCHAKGDALSFVQETENVGFMEAVEILAREAGMTVPAPDPKAREKADRRGELVAVMERAVRYYRRQLAASGGAEARAYLERRGFGPDVQERFSIGYAPHTRQGLFTHLREAGVPAADIVAAGLAAEGDGDDPPYDRFRGRVIFPIRDARGGCIALGGRSLDPRARAKYLNSPETELFDKGRRLYNIAPAREAVGRGAALLVAEGYTDVIALSEAGFGGAVAPLGTAITADQLTLMWRIAPEPVIMLDGDSAGVRAARRIIDMALPLLGAGRGLRFCTLPDRLDPDEFLKAHGPAALARAIEAAEPMVDLLWRRETEGRVFDSPERRAGLEKSLRAAVARIPDADLRRAYEASLRDMQWQAFRQRPARRGTARRGAPAQPVTPLAATRASLLARGDDAVEDRVQEAIILAVLITHPDLIGDFAAQLEDLDLHGDDLARLRAILLRHRPGDGDLRARLRAEAGEDLENLFALGHVRIAPPVRHAEDAALARRCVAEAFVRIAAGRGAQQEIAEAVEDLDGLADEGVTWRLGQAAEARHRAQASRIDAPQDDGENRSALSRELQAMIDNEVWIKKKR